jgi:predicted nucleotidyltransferase
MVTTRTELIATIRRYAEELERLGVPVERIILYGSHQRGVAHKDSDTRLWPIRPLGEGQ